MNYWQAQRVRRQAIDKRRVMVIAKPYQQAVIGGIAFRHGVDPTRCPFVLDTPEWHAWMYGWHEAFERSRG
jgi:hypothetical protein